MINSINSVNRVPSFGTLYVDSKHKILNRKEREAETKSLENLLNTNPLKDDFTYEKNVIYDENKYILKINAKEPEKEPEKGLEKEPENLKTIFEIERKIENKKFMMKQEDKLKNSIENNYKYFKISDTKEKDEKELSKLKENLSLQKHIINAENKIGTSIITAETKVSDF